jgi:hypothetical protein
MHRIHHSQNIQESQSNLANTFSWWDRLFHTYVDNPELTPENMVFGVAEFQSRKHSTLDSGTTLPARTAGPCKQPRSNPAMRIGVLKGGGRLSHLYAGVPVDPLRQPEVGGTRI